MFKLVIIAIGLIFWLIKGLGGIDRFKTVQWEWLGAAFIGAGLWLPLP